MFADKTVVDMTCRGGKRGVVPVVMPFWLPVFTRRQKMNEGIIRDR